MYIRQLSKAPPTDLGKWAGPPDSPGTSPFDIDVVEKANTTIFNTIDSLGLRKINNPALRVRDDALDGSYCYLLFTLYNEAVNTNGLKFNERLGQRKELV